MDLTHQKRTKYQEGQCVISSHNIKWKWHRIDKAAVVQNLTQPDPGVQKFEIKLEPGQASGFLITKEL